ncbi:MAG: HEAT repeat domain-containing protein, partial [Chloroflexi bacterium]|nr:HEAT repeat domain-containing protein [Chloroflexota bacterium]
RDDGIESSFYAPALTSLTQLKASRALDLFLEGVAHFRQFERINDIPVELRARAAIRGVAAVAPTELSVPLLIELLTHTEDLMTQESAAALGRIGDHRAFAPLIDLLKSGRHPSDAAEAAAALANLGDPAAVPHLFQMLDAPSYLTPRAVLRALGQLGDPSIVPQLLPWLEHYHSETAEAAVEALAHIGGEQAMKAIRPYLRTGDGGQRRLVAEAAQRWADQPSVPILAERLQTELQWEARQAAVEALKQLDPNHPALSHDAANDPIPAVREVTRAST